MNNQKSAPLMNENINLKDDMTGVSHFLRYDEGLKAFIKEFFVGDVVITPVDDFWEFYVRNSNDDIKFPAISLYPINYTFNPEQNNFATIQLGSLLQDAAEIRDEDTNKTTGHTMLLSKMVRVMYWDIQYQIDIWALNRNDALQLVQEILFPMYQHKEYQVQYFQHNYSVPYQLDNSFQNNSVVGLTSGQETIYRYTFNITVTAPIFDSKNYYNTIDTSVKLFTHLGEEKSTRTDSLPSKPVDPNHKHQFTKSKTTYTDNGNGTHTITKYHVCPYDNVEEEIAHYIASHIYNEGQCVCGAQEPPENTDKE